MVESTPSSDSSEQNFLKRAKIFTDWCQENGVKSEKLRYPNKGKDGLIGVQITAHI
jgi:hypothetical protein